MKHYSLKLFIVLFGATLFACDSKEEVSDFDRQRLLVNISDTLIMPAYEEVIIQAIALKADLERYKSAPNQAQLSKLQEQWLQLAIAWKTAEAYNFGPIQDLLFTSSIDYLPVDTTGINNAIMSYEAQDNYLTNQGSNKKGIAAMEYVLFAQQEVLMQVNENAKHLAYLELLGDDITQKIQQVLNAWTAAYRDEFVMSTGNAANSGLTLIANQMIFLAEKVKNLKLGIPMAKTGVSTPAPERVEAPYSHSSLKLLQQNIIALQTTFNGGDGSGFDDYLNALDIKDADGQLLSDKINIQFGTVLKAAESIDTDLYQAVENGDPKLDALYLEMINLTILLKNDLMSQLSLLTIFSDNDGD